MSEEIKFGTDGWRAIIGKDFNLKNVEAVAQAIADYLKLDVKCSPVLRFPRADEGADTIKVALGYDTRRLSPEAAKSIAGVLAANKIKVIFSQRPLPTQAISYAVRFYKCVAGIMVTASHNPPRFNGIKIKGIFGGSVENKITDRIEKLIFRHRPVKISFQKAKKKKILKFVDLIPDYLKFVRSYLDMPLLKRGRLKILFDSMHGTADAYIARILKDTPCKVTTIHKNYDSMFGGIKPEPIKTGLREAARLIRIKHFEVGLVCDGDADRIAALDAQGRFVNPQQIISLLLLHLIRYRKLKGAVVKTISGTSLLERIAEKYRLKIYETPVGFKHISYLMQNKDILIGGEEGGGIGFKNYLPERDGILSGLLLIEALICEDKSLSGLLKDMHDEFGNFVYLRKDLKYSSSNRKKIRRRFVGLRKRKNFLGERIEEIKDYDGLKFCLNSGSWILFRLSGTEPILRIYAESNSLTKTKRLIAEGEKIIKF